MQHSYSLTRVLDVEQESRAPRRVVTAERAFGDKTARGEAQFLGTSLMELSKVFCPSVPVDS